MEEQKETQKKEGSTHKIRTFKDDLANAVRSGGVSTAKIAIKEQQRRRALGIDKQGEEKKSHKVLIGIVSFIFLFVALGIFAVLGINPELSFLNKTPVQTKEAVFTPMFENESNIKLGIVAGKTTVFSMFDGLSQNGEVDKLQIFNFYTIDVLEELSLASSEEFFKYIQATPDRLPRFIKRVSYGLDGLSPFLLMEVSDFENAFAGMIKWEGTMTRDLEPVFHKIRETTVETEIPNPEYVEHIDVVVENIETDEASEDETIEIPETIIKTTKVNWRNAKYYDEILFNKDSRILKKDSGEEGIMYTFLDNNYILISTEKTTIKKVLDVVGEYYIANY